MAAWRPSGLLRALLIWSAVTFITFWLPGVRGAFDGPTYEWAGYGFRGAGVGGDFWFVALGSVLAIAFLALGWRGARFPFALLLLGWHGFLAAGATRLALTGPEDFRFRGDTLGVDVSLAWIGPTLFGGFFLLAVVWTLRGRRVAPGEVPAWNARNRRLAWTAAGLLPLQFVLLRYGVPHGTTDALGVLLTMAQWAIISMALYPWRERSTAAPAAVGAPAAGVGG